jgi:hypothetical protein
MSLCVPLLEFNLFFLHPNFHWPHILDKSNPTNREFVQKLLQTNLFVPHVSGAIFQCELGIFLLQGLYAHQVCNALSLDGEKLLETCHAAIAGLESAGTAA